MLSCLFGLLCILKIYIFLSYLEIYIKACAFWCLVIYVSEFLCSSLKINWFSNDKQILNRAQRLHNEITKLSCCRITTDQWMIFPRVSYYFTAPAVKANSKSDQMMGVNKWNLFERSILPLLSNKLLHPHLKTCCSRHLLLSSMRKITFSIRLWIFFSFMTTRLYKCSLL